MLFKNRLLFPKNVFEFLPHFKCVQTEGFPSWNGLHHILCTCSWFITWIITHACAYIYKYVRNVGFSIFYAMCVHSAICAWPWCWLAKAFVMPNISVDTFCFCTTTWSMCVYRVVRQNSAVCACEQNKEVINKEQCSFLRVICVETVQGRLWWQLQRFVGGCECHRVGNPGMSE